MIIKHYQIANQETDEDNALVLTMIATDVDEDVLIFLLQMVILLMLMAIS